MLSLVLALAILSSKVFADNLASILANAAQQGGVGSVFNFISQDPDLANLLSSPCVTVFLPNDTAFASVQSSNFTQQQIKDIISYHIVPCSGGPFNSTSTPVYGVYDTALSGPNEYVLFNGSQKIVVQNTDGSGVIINANRPYPTVNVVNSTNITGDNGIAYIIDNVLLPPPSIPESLATTQAYNLTTLLSLINQYYLNTSLATTPGLTLFAPTNDAFDQLGQDTIPEEMLLSVLQYHIVGNYVTSNDLSSAQNTTLQTYNGETINVTAENGTFMVNNASILFSDLLASNGVIHVIDTVLLPPNMTNLTNATSSSNNNASSNSENGIFQGSSSSSKVSMSLAGLILPAFVALFM